MQEEIFVKFFTLSMRWKERNTESQKKSVGECKSIIEVGFYLDSMCLIQVILTFGPQGL